MYNLAGILSNAALTVQGGVWTEYPNITHPTIATGDGRNQRLM